MSDLLPCPPEGYSLSRTIGRGASSVVWEARRLATGEAVALKILEADVSDPGAARGFEREREAMTAPARHPNILTIVDAGVVAGRPWLATELCRRGSLASYVADGGPLEVPTALRVLHRLAGALAGAHEAGVVHCDIKPANVMLTDLGEPALGDFGIARVSVGQAATTTVGGFSLDHVAPELLDDGKRTPRTDVYSLGTTTWELLVGDPPFRNSGDVSVGTVITRILRRPLPESERIPDDVLALLRTMAAKDPDERPASMTEVADAVRALAVARGIELDEPALPPLTAVQLQVIEALSAPTVVVAPPTFVGPESVPPAVVGPESVATFVGPESVARTYIPAAPAGGGIGVAPGPGVRAPGLTGPGAAAAAARARRRRLPLVAASVIAVLISVGTAFGLRHAPDDATPPRVAIEPAAMVPTTTPTTTAVAALPEPAVTAAPEPAVSSSTARRARTTTTPRRTRATRAPAVAPRPAPAPAPAPVPAPAPGRAAAPVADPDPDPEPPRTTTRKPKPPPTSDPAPDPEPPPVTVTPEVAPVDPEPPANDS